MVGASLPLYSDVGKVIEALETQAVVSGVVFVAAMRSPNERPLEKVYPW